MNTGDVGTSLSMIRVMRTALTLAGFGAKSQRNA
jgi:hypothetical protein